MTKRLKNGVIFVLVGGYKGAGKNTVVSHVTECYPNVGFPHSEMSFAQPIKDLAKDIYRWDGLKDEFGRALLQVIGDVLREVPRRVATQLGKNLFDNQGIPEHDTLPEQTSRRTKAIERGEKLAEAKFGADFDPLIDYVFDHAQPGIVFVTDARMPFEFEGFHDDNAVKIWIDSAWAKSSNHVTERLNPALVSGLTRLTNTADHPEDTAEVIASLVAAKVRQWLRR